MQDHEIEIFYKKFSPRIFRYLQLYLPNEIAQELLNDVFLDAVEEITKLKRQKNLSAWLHKIAHNKMVDYYRKQKIKSFLLSQIPFLEIIAEEITQPEFIMEKNKVRDNIETTILALSHNYQTILRMHYEEQMPIKLIAVELNLSPKAAESLLYRARQQFIKVYERK